MGGFLILWNQKSFDPWERLECGVINKCSPQGWNDVLDWIEDHITKRSSPLRILAAKLERIAGEGV